MASSRGGIDEVGPPLSPLQIKVLFGFSSPLSLSLSPRHASPLIFPNHDMLLLSSSPTSAPLEDKGFGGGKASQALDMAEEQGPCWRWRRMGQVEIGEL
jgi:hypothetical protein